MRLVKLHGSEYSSTIDMNSTSTPITIYAVDETTNAPINCTWYLSADDGGTASFIGSLNTPVVNGVANVGIDPSDTVYVQAASTAVTGTSVVFYPSNPNLRNASAHAKLVATSSGQSRSMLINIS